MLIKNNYYTIIKGFMMIGNTVTDSNKKFSSKDRISHGLSIKNDSLKIPEATKNQENLQKKKITTNFETALTKRLVDDREHQKSQEEVKYLVESVMCVIGQITSDFGQETATEAMAKILTSTEQRINANTIATAVGTVFKAREFLVNKILSRKTNEADIPEITKTYGSDLEPEEFMRKVEKDAENLEKMVEFLNKANETTDIVGQQISSLSSALNTYYGDVIISDEDFYCFSNKFDWLKADGVKVKNSAYLSQDYGFDFAISVSEFGRENLTELINFLRTDLKDDNSANFIQNLTDNNDIFAAINYIFNKHFDNEPVKAAKGVMESFKEKFLTEKDENYWNEYNAKREAAYERLTDPDYELPQFDYNSKYGFGYIGEEYNATDYNFNYTLDNFLRTRLLDRVNDVIRDNSAVRERFLKVAVKNFSSREESVPDNYGLFTFPSTYNMGTVSTSYIMKVMDTTAEERALNELYAISFTNILKLDNSKYKDKITAVPDLEELVDANKIAIYNEATARYENEKKEKGLLLKETI
jgi:hypothetical protein